MKPSCADLEQAYLPFRTGRAVVLRKIVSAVGNGLLPDPALFFSRFFARLKGADSVIEKMQRKGIVLESLLELPRKIDDVLGMRAIVDSMAELATMDAWIRSTFEVLTVVDNSRDPDEFGQRGIAYGLCCNDGEARFPFELQLRTFLQHIFATRSFHLFHKQPREVRLAHKEQLCDLSRGLDQAEQAAAALGRAPTATADNRLGDRVKGLTDAVHVVLIGPGERLSEHRVLQLSSDHERDHEAIAKLKIGLYERHAGSAVVEASCIHMSTYLLNEPQVVVPTELMAATF